jgi:translocation and assembly module TamA
VPACRISSALVLALLMIAVDVTRARAADADATPQPADAASPQVASEPVYRAVVEAPAPLEAILTRDVGLVRWQSYAGMTDELLERLMHEAVDESREAAAAEGYFSAVTRVTIDRTTHPAVVTLAVTPGEPTQITSVRISVTGPAATDAPLGTDAIATLTRDWALPKGEIFRQAAWSAAKQKAVATLAASPYAAARITHSEALIDPQSRSAELVVDIDSGPRFRFGSLDIKGLAKYSPSLVRNFNTIEVGEPYRAVELNNYVRRLNASGYFASAQAAIDPDSTHPDDATVDVASAIRPTCSCAPMRATAT